MLELADRAGVRLPAQEPNALADFMLVRDARNLGEYLQRFETTLSVMQSAEAMERIAFEFVEDVAGEGIRYVEVRFCPALHPGVGSEAALEAAVAGLARGTAATGTRANAIICGLRTLSPTVSLAMAELAVRWCGRGVVAFDLAGNEAGYPASAHVEAFRVARAGGVALTCHAGEGAGSESIRDALDVCSAQRIGHGVRLKEDAELYARVRAGGVPLEMCPTSNVHTRTVPRLESHPLAEYLGAGIPVTLNTDSRLMDRITLVDEYLAVQAKLGLDRDTLVRIARNGFAHAFVEEAERGVMLATFDAAVTVLA